MWKESDEKKTPLRKGLTTGSCATACCVAASSVLLAGSKPSKVTISLPKGQLKKMLIKEYKLKGDSVYASTIKDAGDDPDVTHGATVFVELVKKHEPGIIFIAAEGVGTVTLEGLELGVGEPAINPIPRKMMTEHLERMAKDHQYSGGFNVRVGIMNGDAIAQKTMNPRLGIIGGLSILGTTGIVRPYSCSAWIASIHQGIDIARANGITHIAATTGSTSEQAISEHYRLPEMALIEMGDFIGAVLKHLKRAPIQVLTICGGFGKITKFANGHMDLNSRASSIDFYHMADVAKGLGANDKICSDIVVANTSMEVLRICLDNKIDIAHKMCELALQHAQSVLPKYIEVDVWAVDRKGNFVGSAGVSEMGRS